MSKDSNIYQSLENITISYIKEISGLKKELSEKQLEIDRKDNELSKALVKIGELEAKLNVKKPN